MAVKISGVEVIDNSRNITTNIGTVDGRDIAADGAKLDGIASGAEVNQNAFSSIAVAGQSDVVADTKTDAVTFVAGTGVSITTDASTDAVTFTNSAPDQVVSLTGSGATSVSGTYPNFTISSTDNNTTYTAGSGLTLTGTSFSANIGTDILAYDANLQSFVSTFTLPTADGSTGQVLTTNGAGNLSFTTISGYTDADVDTHLNTSTAASGEVLSWNGSDYDWVTAGGAFTEDGSNNLYAIATLPNLTTGYGNFVAGPNAGNGLTSGFENIAFGSGALEGATTGGYNIALGRKAMGGGGATTAFGRNVALGELAGERITSGALNIAIGYEALRYTTTGGSNIAIGSEAMGGSALTNAGGLNIAIGDQAGVDLTSATGNLLLGRRAGWNITTGINNVMLGRDTSSVTTTGSNQIVIGSSAAASSATVSNEITLGNSSIATLRCQVTTITSLSDARDKTDIQPLNAGLEFVEALNPVSFTWNMRDGGKVGEADTGFIAQDLQMAQEWAGVTIPGLVYDVNPDKLEAGYGKLIPVLVQAIKDLSAKVNLLEAQLEAQK